MSWSMGHAVGSWFIEKIGALFNPDVVVVPKQQLTISTTAKENLCIEFVDNAEKIVDQKKKIEDFVATSQGKISQNAAWFLWKCLPLCLSRGVSIDTLSYSDDVIDVQISQWKDIMTFTIDKSGEVNHVHFRSGTASVHSLEPKGFPNYKEPSFSELLDKYFTHK